LEGELNKFREDVEKTVNELLEGLKNSFSRISEIESKVFSQKSSPELWEALKEVKGVKQQVKEDVKRVGKNLFQEFKALRKKMRSSFGKSEELRDYVEDRLSDLEDFLDARFDETRDKLDDFLDKAEDIESEIRRRIRELKGESVPVMAFKVPGGEVRIPDIGKLIESSLSKAWSGVPSMVVSSVRLPKADLELIDALVEAGIFKSRNEGIAFFAHKGIEASRDWLNKVREKIEEIKRLQKETKREMEKMFSETINEDEAKKES
jgi:Arc/MetJ-type ribon-helix-helix transcriptional regulator